MVERKLSSPFICWDWCEVGDVSDDIGDGLAGLRTDLFPMLLLGLWCIPLWLIFLSTWHECFPPDNAGVVNGTEDVEDFALFPGVPEHLLRPAALVPTEHHVFVDRIINITNCPNHIIELIS